MKNTPLISVVVCTYNGATKIEKCLDALKKQTLDKLLYEVIVVNDGSTDNTKEVLGKYSFKVITNNPNMGLACARNKGVLASKAEIIAFTDDDCIPDVNWLGCILSAYDDMSVIGVGGKVVPYATDKWLLRYYEVFNPLSHLSFDLTKSSGFVYRFLKYVSRSLYLNEIQSSENRLSMIVGANMSIRRIAYDNVHGFDNSFRFGGEEEDLWKRLLKSSPDGILRYTSKAIIKHDYDSSFKDAMRRNFSYGKGSARLFVKYNDHIAAIYPFPIIVLLSSILSILHLYLLGIALIFPLILYPGWVRLAIYRRRISYLLFAFVQSLLELCITVGFIYGFLKFRKGLSENNVR